MEPKPLTIDRLPIDVSNRYAEDQEKLKLGRPLIDESRLFPTKPEMAAAVSSYVPVETVEWLGIGALKQWAAFTPPPGNAIHAAVLFSYQFIPSMGSSETLQTISDKLESLKNTIPQDKIHQYEYMTVCNLFKDLIEKFRTFDLIMSRCKQFEKG